MKKIITYICALGLLCSLVYCTKTEYFYTEGGENGSEIYAGEGAPTADKGRIGDYYLDQSTLDFYRKTDIGWTKQANLRGLDGKQGKQGKETPMPMNLLSGEGAPTLEIGKDGDIYIDIVGRKIYGPKTPSGWNMGRTLSLGEPFKYFYVSVPTLSLKPQTSVVVRIVGNKDYQIEVTPQSTVSTTLSEDKESLTVEGLKEGNAIVKISDLKLGKSHEMKVNVSKDAATMHYSPSDYRLSLDGKTLLEWYKTDLEIIDMTQDPILKEITQVGGRDDKFGDNYASIFYDKNTNKNRELKVKKFVFSDKVTVVGKGTFFLSTYFNNNPMQEIILPKGLQRIETDAFYAGGFSKIELPEGLTEIGDNAFRWCYALEEIEIPQSVTKIGKGAFVMCDKLQKVHLPKDLKVVEESTFYFCKSLAEVHLPEGLTTIEKEAFKECKALKDINLPNNITTIGESVFYNCEALNSVTLPNSLKEMHTNLFYGCDKLSSITLPEGLTKIDGGALAFCKELKSVNLPSSLNELGNRVFQESGIETMTLPKAVTKIGDGLFQGCYNLTKVVIPEGIKVIPQFMFFNCKSLTDLTLPASVETIEANAFKLCAFEKLTLPQSLQTIGSDAFNSCKALTTIVLPQGLKVVEGGAFRDCQQLTAIVFPDSVTEIGSSALNGCKSLVRVTLPKGLKKIDNYLLANCSALTSLTIPDSVTEIGGYSFDGCKALKSLTIPAQVTKIKDTSFNNTGITEIHLLSVTPIEVDQQSWRKGDLFRSTPIEKIKVPTEEAAKKYKAADFWKDYSTKIGI